MFRHIREALAYIPAYVGRVFVLKIGKDVLQRAQEIGLVQNISQLYDHKIRIIVVHAVRDFNPKDWPGLDGKGIKCGIENREGIDGVLRKASRIPFVYCGHDQEFRSDYLAAELAASLKADKLIYLTDAEVLGPDGAILHQVTMDTAKSLLGFLQGHMREKMESAILALKGGVKRIHIVNVGEEDALLGELLTSEGVGSMVYEKTYFAMGFAKTGERTEIIDIIRSAEFPETVDVRRATQHVTHFCVRRYDNTVHGCVLLTSHKAARTLELAYLATSRIYEDGSDAEELLLAAIKKAKERNLAHLFMETAKSQIWLGIYPWFLRHGFKRRALGEVLPAALAGRDPNTEVWYAPLL